MTRVRFLRPNPTFERLAVAEIEALLDRGEGLSALPGRLFA